MVSQGGGNNDRGKLDRGYPAFTAGHSDGGEALVGAEQFVDAPEVGVDSLRRLEKVFSQHIVAQAAGLGAGAQQAPQRLGQRASIKGCVRVQQARDTGRAGTGACPYAPGER